MDEDAPRSLLLPEIENMGACSEDTGKQELTQG